ncbi:MAG: glutamine amidotransferase [Alphaproteobacteria bacterium]
MQTVNVIRHLAFEDLGAFEPVLTQAGYSIRYHDIGVDDISALNPHDAGLLVVLGGPIGAYEDDKYPFLSGEIEHLAARLAADKPTMGICLGAQLMARALGARVYPGAEKEIGFAPLSLTESGRASCLGVFESEPVLHWHGDIFDLPDGATCLASTRVCPNQAFSYGANAIAFQFHPEAGGAGFERWLIGHTAELAQAGKDIPQLRAENERLAPGLKRRAETCLQQWLAQLK